MQCGIRRPDKPNLDTKKDRYKPYAPRLTYRMCSPTPHIHWQVARGQLFAAQRNGGFRHLASLGHSLRVYR
jgi:hypothetical protein